MYWAEALANQSKDETLKNRFQPIVNKLKENETIILDELNAAQGNPVDINGYYFADDHLAAEQMRPSATFNGILKGIA